MGYENRRYAVVPYRDEWRATYEREAALIKDTLRDELVFIEHVGATAVPGVSGAGALDILAAVRDIAQIGRYETALRTIGYEALREFIAENAWFFKKDLLHDTGEEERAVNLHIFPEEHPTMMGMLDVRDYLLAHGDEARKYRAIKEKLFQKHPRDYAAYREGKDAYLARLYGKATKWKGRHFPEEKGMV